MLLKRTVVFVFLIFVIFVSSRYCYTHRDELSLITNVSPAAIFELGLLNLMLFYLLGLQIKVVTDHYGLNLKFRVWMGLSRGASFTNLLIPFSGASLKAVYLRKFYNFKYSSFIASMTLANIIKIMISSAFALGVLIYINKEVDSLLILISGVIFFSSLLFVFYTHNTKRSFFSFSERLSMLAEEWRGFKGDKTMIRRLIILNGLFFVFSTLGIFVSYRAFSIDTSLTACIVISSFTVLLQVVNIIPANIGLKEAVFVAVSNQLGMGFNEGVHAAAFHRIIGVLLTIGVSPFLGVMLKTVKVGSDD